MLLKLPNLPFRPLGRADVCGLRRGYLPHPHDMLDWLAFLPLGCPPTFVFFNPLLLLCIQPAHRFAMLSELQVNLPKPDDRTGWAAASCPKP